MPVEALAPKAKAINVTMTTPIPLRPDLAAPNMKAAKSEMKNATDFF